MNSREDFIKFIPKPKNEDVVLYDISLKDLIDVDVLKEYQELYPIFISKKQEYLKLREEIKIYEETINNIYLLNPSWSEEDYLQKLQNDKKTYSILFNNIKKAESNIEILQKKIKGIDEKIQIQIAREENFKKAKKETIEKDIEKNKEKLSNFKIYINGYKESLNFINNKIQENEEDFQLLKIMESQLNIGEYKCIYCGSKVKIASENSLIFKRLYKNIEKNKNELEKLLDQKNKLELNLSYYESEVSKIKSDLNNDINFKKDNKNIYIKKSIEVLKLEALKDEMLNNISKFEKQIKNDSHTNSKQYISLKNDIDKYELSLNNLKKIKEMKNSLKSKIEEYKEKEKELKMIINKMDQYIKFISIYYKIYEQKANEYCGPNYKFKFFKIEDYKLIKIFSISYKGIDYTQLSNEDRDEVDKNLIQKFSIYF